MRGIRAVCLDLDDTLWPVGPAIARAEQAMLGWLADHCPVVLERHDAASMRAVRADVAAAHPDRRHDLTFLRRRSLERLVVEAGYPAEAAEGAFAAFFAERNRVDLFADVLPALERLAPRFRLLALSNGNADLGLIGLAAHFEFALSAREAGAAKPDRRIFEVLLERSALAPHEVVYVGDDPRADIEGARGAGLPAVWVDRAGQTWPADIEPPLHRVAHLGELVELLSR